MKLKDIDFRVWNYTKKEYEEYPALAKMGSVVPAKSHHIRAKPFLEYDESGDELEVEFWTGYRDLNLTKIYEGDILRYYRRSNYKPYVDFCIVFKRFKIVLKPLHEKDKGFLTEYNQKAICLDSEIIGNIHKTTKSKK